MLPWAWPEAMLCRICDHQTSIVANTLFLSNLPILFIWIVIKIVTITSNLSNITKKL
ncbi:hypothetical protein BDR07DRAFT_1410039 [Suillus spraguei]|nr:hypothetical protein BDR07DRAFT_1410039 [Suillus spraguei]